LKEIKEALKKLGITGKIKIEKYDSFTVTVYVDGKKFGLWDTVKKTFVE
jgi:hypothetical protein